MANRYNLRIGIVTDPEVIKATKLEMPDYFEDIGLSVMLLRRYDGHIFKINLAEL